jgi:hypothetical protein
MPILGSIVRDSTFGTALGRGIDGGTGSIRGEPVDFAPPTMSSEGQSSIFHMKQLETVEDITKSFDMSVDGEAQFSMFGGSDKFKFLHEVKVQNYHLYLFVQAIVTNPALILSDVRLKPRAFDLIARDPQRFHEEFGDFFVLGTQTGGEYAALLDVHTSDLTEHDTMSNELQAAGFAGGVAFAADAKISVEKCVHLKTARVEITEMEIGGQGDPKPIDALRVIDKATKFRKDAFEHGVNVKILLQDYLALDLPPGANQVKLQHQKTVLADCFKQRTTLLQGLNSVEFILINPGQFEPPSAGVDLNEFRDQLAKAINVYDEAASNCLDDFRQCQLVTPAPRTPDLRKLPNRRPGVGIFNGVWMNDDSNASLERLRIDGFELQRAHVVGFFRGVSSQVLADGSRADSNGLSVFLDVHKVTGGILHPGSFHNLRIELGDDKGVSLRVTDTTGNEFLGTQTSVFTFSRSA